MKEEHMNIKKKRLQERTKCNYKTHKKQQNYIVPKNIFMGVWGMYGGCILCMHVYIGERMRKVDCVESFDG